MSKHSTVGDYPESYDWENDEDLDDRESAREQIGNNRISRKRNIKRRLDDYLEEKRLRKKSRHLDSFDFEKDYDYQ